jgi:hypothetical protein
MAIFEALQNDGFLQLGIYTATLHSSALAYLSLGNVLNLTTALHF